MHIRLSYVLLLAAFVVSLVFDVLFYSAENLGINMLLAELAFLGVSLWLAKSQKITVTRPAKIAAGFALAFALTFAIWTSPWSLTMCLVGFLVANTLFAVFVLGEAAHFRHPFDIISHLIVAPAKHAIFAIPFVRTLLPERLGPQAQSVVKAIIIALPILLIFTLIFAAADAVFQSHIVNAFRGIDNWASVENIVGHVFFLGFFVVLMGLFFAAAFWRRKEFPKKSPDLTARAVLESKIILGSVAGLFAIFIVVSGAALFGGSAVFADLDITYAEYARQGFGQLCAAAALVIGLILTLRVLHTETVDKRLMGLQVVLLVEAGLVLVSAFMRLGMYIDAYGYTPARLFGMWFFALITVFLALTLVNTITQKHQSALVMQMLNISAVAILLFAVIAPDALSVRMNAARADAEHPLTFERGLQDLSEEAYPTIARVYADSAQPTENHWRLREPAPTFEEYCTALVGKSLRDMSSDERKIHSDYVSRSSILNFFHADRETTDTWQSWNLARSRATHVDAEIPEWLDEAHTFIDGGFALDAKGIGQSPSCEQSTQ